LGAGRVGLPLLGSSGLVFQPVGAWGDRVFYQVGGKLVASRPGVRESVLDVNEFHHVDCVGVFAGFATEGGDVLEDFGVDDMFLGRLCGAFL
jgi:hypothetical protein